MSKKSILSTLLISSALLGTISASAATSAIKPEKKLVSVEKSNAKIYKNSKLQESKKAKKGTVYKVDGYRNINSKKYYRVYQEDTKGKVVYKGYILDKDTKVLKGQKPAKKDRLVALTKDDQTAWKSLYFNKKIKTYDGTKHSSNFEVKYSYNIGGKKYFSLYRGEKWMGYMDGSAFKVLTPKHLADDKQDYKVVKDYETYNDIYFTEKGQLKVGEKVKVKNIYTFGTGRQYGSIYNKDGKWLGYANMKALEAVETSTPDKPVTPPEKPEEKPDGNKPGTGGDTSKPDTKPDNPGDKPTDKPDGDKPGQGGDNKPGGDQGGSGSGDTGNKPGDSGTGDSGSGSQPGGGDQGGNPGTGGGDQGGSGDTGTGGDQPSQPDQPGQPDNPGTGGGDTETPEQPKPEKPTESEVKALQDAVDKAKKVVAAKDKLDGVEPVEHALEKAEKILADKDKTQKDVVNATKEIEAAIKGITLKPSVNKDSIIALHNAIEQLKETQKLGADNLVNNEQYDKVLKDAEKVLEDAINGKADKAKIDAETKKVNDFINKLQLNTKALEDKINAVKAKGDKVYMTKEQETKFNDFITKAKEAAKNTQLSNTEKLKEIDAQLKKAEDFIKGQPTETDVKKLIKATQKEQEVATQLKGKEDQIFENWNTVTTKDEAADQMLTEIKKDKSPSDNKAEKPYTAKDVQEATKELMDSMANLEVNHTNLKKYDDAAKEAINDLDEAHKEAAQDLLTSFEVAVGDASVKDLTQMVNAANSLNTEIHKDQVEEINSVIEKAKRIEGITKSKENGEVAPNAKFYETSSYGAMNTALGQAEEAEKDLVGEKTVSRSKRSVEAGVTQVQNGKVAAEKENVLKEKIKELKVKDWKVDETTDGIIKLTKYEGSYESTADAKKTGEQVIEIPGSLKDKQVVVESSKDKQLFDAKNSGNGAAEVKFEVATDGRKPKTGADFSYAFANNKEIGTVDVTDLDTKDMTKMENTFMNDFYLNKIEGSEKLVHAGVTSLKAAFAGTNLHTLNASNWDTEGVTNMRAMFKGSNITTVTGMENWKTEKVTDFNYMFGATKFKTLDLSKWNMNAANNASIEHMFNSSTKKGGAKADITEITLPNHHNGKPEDVVKALENAGKQTQLNSNVTVKAIVEKPQADTIGKVTTSGNWEPERAYEKGDTLETDKNILNDPVSLCSLVMDSEAKGDNAESAKQLAQLLDEVAYPVWTYSTGHKVIKSRGGEVLIDSEINDENNQGLVNDGGWSSFEKLGSGHYYKAMELLQKYARNTNSVTKNQFEDTIKQLVSDFKGMKVITTDLEKLVKEAEGSKSETKQELTLVKNANDYIKDPSLDNWKNIVETTKELREALADKK